MQNTLSRSARLSGLLALGLLLLTVKGNGSSNLDEDTSSGACTALNNKAP